MYRRERAERRQEVEYTATDLRYEIKPEEYTVYTHKHTHTIYVYMYTHTHTHTHTHNPKH